MSKEKPWHAHKFTAVKLHPTSCVVCGQPRGEKQHKVYRRKFKWAKIIKNKEQIYGDPD